MTKIAFVAALFGLALATTSAQAWESWNPSVGCTRKPIAEVAPQNCGCCRPRHHHVVHHAAPAPLPAPVKVEEKPVIHETHIIEKVIVDHVVEERRTVVVAPQPQCCARPIVQPLKCCPPGMNIPNLPRCGTSAGVSYPGRQASGEAASGNWTNQGKNELCAARPKGVPFKCVSPSSGQETNCVCN